MNKMYGTVLLKKNPAIFIDYYLNVTKTNTLEMHACYDDSYANFTFLICIMLKHEITVITCTCISNCSF